MGGATGIEQRIAAIKAAVKFTNDDAVVAPYQLLALAVDQLRAGLLAIERFDAQIAAIAMTIPNYAPISALPGAGAVPAPRLLRLCPASSANVFSPRKNSSRHNLFANDGFP